MTGRSMFRVLRWVGLAAVAPVLWACNARSLEAPVLKPEATFGKTFQQSVNRNVDMLFLVDDSSSMRLSQANLERNFPSFMTTLKNAPRTGLPNVHVAVDLVGHGRGRRLGRQLRRGGGKNGIFQYTARGSCAATNLQQGATFISDSGGVRELHRQHRGRVHLHRGARRDGLRLRAPVRLDPARARRRRPGRPRREPGLPPPRGVPGDRPHHQRGRLLGLAGRAAVRHRLQHQHHVAARPARELPLQRVRSPVRRRASEPQRAEQRRHRRRSATPTARRTTARATCSASSTPRTGSRRSRRDPSQVIVAAITGPNDALHRELEGPELGGYVVRRRVLPLAGHRALVHGGRHAASRTPSFASASSWASSAPTASCCSICADNFAPSLQRIGELINAVAAAALHHRHGRQQARHAGSGLHGRQPHLERPGQLRRLARWRRAPRTAARRPAGGSRPACARQVEPARSSTSRST